MKGKQINKTDLNNINVMLSKGLGVTQIARIIGCSKTTISRVRDGKHVLQLAEKHAENPAEEPKIADGKNSEVEQKLDTIIELLKDIKQLWS